MTGESGLHLRWPALVASALLLVAAGATVAYLAIGSDDRVVKTSAAPAVAAAPPSAVGAPAAAPGQPLADVVVSLSEEAVKRAGITVAAVTEGAGTGALRLPALVEPNAYRQVVVTSVAGGRVTQVLAELGVEVRQGQPMAQIFSPELADAETRFIAASAELDAHERELERTEKLVQIGSASRQELERIHSEHTAKKSGVEASRARLQLFGISAAAIASLGPGKNVAPTIDVPAPITGVVTERLVNTGLNVDPTTKLFTVVDMTNVWVVADLYERDFAQVRVGGTVHVTTTAYPDRRFTGRISYIDPQVNAQSRTAKLRVEVPNPRKELRFGMFAEVKVEISGKTTALLVPKASVQSVADRSLVYLATPGKPGQFREREVRLGGEDGDRVVVLSGVGRDDSVVSDGSFFLRAERERLGLRQPVQRGSSPSPSIQTATIVLGEQGYEPAKVSLRAGVPARLTFLRTTDKTCGTEVTIPSLNIKRALPLNAPVDIDFTPANSGEISFVCGMNMLRGSIVVQ